MKREIYCMKCKKIVKDAIDAGGSLPPGEHVKYVDGKALDNMVCDFCNIAIYEGQICTAFSIYIDGQAPYEPWEHESIKVLEEPREAGPFDEIVPMGVYRLLITGSDDQLLTFHLNLSIVLNFLERRHNTVMATCMQESLDLAIGAAKKWDITLQYIHYVEDEETYPLLNKGTYKPWEKGGYKDED